MRVSVLMNSKAGSVNPSLIRRKIGEALFRCDLHFSEPQSVKDSYEFIRNEIEKKTNALVICGGDGTINTCLQILLKFDKSARVPICLVRSGTANDLAHELGVHRRIDRAARSLLEGQINFVDLIEIQDLNQSDNQDHRKTSIMISNGGLGIPAQAAHYSNLLRENFRSLIESQKTSPQWIKNLGATSYELLKQMGPTVYSLTALYAIQKWDRPQWELEFTFPDNVKITTKSPVILVNNQPSIGKNFIPAPYTSNTDGLVNVLLAHSESFWEHLQIMNKLKKGRVFDKKYFNFYEVPFFEVRALNPDETFSFFGDGEVLIQNTRQIHVRCLHQELPIYLQQKDQY